MRTHPDAGGPTVHRGILPQEICAEAQLRPRAQILQFDLKLRPSAEYFRVDLIDGSTLQWRCYSEHVGFPTRPDGLNVLEDCE